MTAPVEVFVAREGNAFMRDIAEWIAEACSLAGWCATVVDDRLPAASSATNGVINLVVAPHEMFELFDAPRADLQRAAAASICVCTEQPGTRWFHLSVDACRRGMLSLDINAAGVQALRSVGVKALRLPLGAVPSIVAAPRERTVDVLFLGGLDDRRGAILAGVAPHLVRRRAELRLFRFEKPVGDATPGLAFGREKYELLASTRVLLNLHRDRSADLPPGAPAVRYFEWARMIEAMANGCVVLTEPSEGFEPLVPGIHFVEAQPDEIGAVLDALLDDDDRRTRIATAAFDAVTGPMALATAVAPILAHLERDVLPDLAAHVASSSPTRGLWRLGSTRLPPPVRLGPFKPYTVHQRAAKELALADSRALRRLDATACLLRHGAMQHVEELTTPSYAAATPEITVVVSLYNYADVVTETLASVVSSQGVAFELVVVDDHSTDRSRAVVTEFLADHPHVPGLLLGKDANEGLAAARNSGFERARASLVMVLDADNLLFPHGLRRLADALTTDPDASSAYGILAEFGDSAGLRSALAWDVERLCRANYIDAQAMVRRSAWRDLGGYRGDDEIHGWEDWDLWLRLAAAGRRAVLVPEVLGRYRVRAGSMIALTNLATEDMLDALERRYPDLPWPESRP